VVEVKQETEDELIARDSFAGDDEGEWELDGIVKGERIDS
jgi:hypothetical protein